MVLVLPQPRRTQHKRPRDPVLLQEHFAVDVRWRRWQFVCRQVDDFDSFSSVWIVILDLLAKNVGASDNALAGLEPLRRLLVEDAVLWRRERCHDFPEQIMNRDN